MIVVAITSRPESRPMASLVNFPHLIQPVLFSLKVLAKAGRPAPQSSCTAGCRRSVCPPSAMELVSDDKTLLGTHFKAVAVARRTCEIGGEGTANERTANRWFNRFNSGELTLVNSSSTVISATGTVVQDSGQSVRVQANGTRRRFTVHPTKEDFDFVTRRCVAKPTKLDTSEEVKLPFWYDEKASALSLLRLLPRCSEYPIFTLYVLEPLAGGGPSELSRCNIGIAHMTPYSYI
ncbi:hypothetical protein EVAR_4577_1 [Eumeta japonica]|uniref:Mos1 transposase HTH domain-containing protein n=1 Tax=Eumeta variegata TaxID=151549 RepID=A0A4C1SYU6_EUMVA|nr:hypothetical protein EVAR_4577_1 [Eumeta japonica]